MHLLPTRMGAAVAAVALTVSAVPAHASAFPCFEESSMQSARIHDLRVMLMVNSLKCRQMSPSTLRKYGKFLDERSDELSAHGDKVEQSMVARFGPDQGRQAFNHYETRIGNYHSGTRPTHELCQDVKTFMKLASRANHSELETLSKLATNRSISTCHASEAAVFVPAVAERSAEAASDAAALIDTADTNAPAEPQIVDGVPTFMTPGIGLDSTPEPVETVSLAEPEASAAEPDKLSQAITALDAAAAALRDMQAEKQPAIE